MGALGRDAAWEGCWVAQSNCHSEAVSEPIMGRSLLAGTAPPPHFARSGFDKTNMLWFVCLKHRMDESIRTS